MDSKNSLQHGDLDEEIYMEKPPFFYDRFYSCLSTQEVTVWFEEGPSIFL